MGLSDGLNESHALTDPDIAGGIERVKAWHGCTVTEDCTASLHYTICPRMLDTYWAMYTRSLLYDQP